MRHVAPTRPDPALTAGVTQGQNDTPRLGPLVGGPFGLGVGGSQVGVTRSTFGLSKVNTLGGRLGLDLADTITRDPGSAGLNPLESRAAELSYTQPLLRGGGFLVNTAPIVLARIDTERSYFQFKDATQELVRGTIEAYWNLVFARVNLWARENQLRLSRFTYEQAEAAQDLLECIKARHPARRVPTLERCRRVPP